MDGMDFEWGQFAVELGRKVKWNPSLHPRFGAGNGLNSGRFMRSSDRDGGGGGSWSPDPYVDPRVDDWDPGESVRNARQSGEGATWGRRFGDRMGTPRPDDQNGSLFIDGDEPRTMNAEQIRNAVIESAPTHRRAMARRIVEDSEFFQDIGEEPQPGQTVEDTYHDVGSRFEEYLRDYRDEGYDPSMFGDNDWAEAMEQFAGNMLDD